MAIAESGKWIIKQGETISLTFTYTDDSGNAIDLSAYNDIRLQIRETVDAATTLIDASLGGSYISFTTDGSDGKFEIVVPAADTAAISATSGFYDLELETGGGVVTRILDGAVTFLSEVTR